MRFLEVGDPSRLERGAPGIVLVDGVQVRWNVVGQEVWRTLAVRARPTG